MKCLVSTSYIEVIGGIWWPMGAQCGLRIELTSYDIENIRGYSHRDATDKDVPGLPVTREGIELWLGCHAGDFSEITDFSASIKDGEKTVDFEWSDEDNEMTYHDAMYGSED